MHSVTKLQRTHTHTHRHIHTVACCGGYTRIWRGTYLPGRTVNCPKTMTECVAGGGRRLKGVEGGGM